MLIFGCTLLAFLIGGIPFGYLLGRVILKDDIRNHGSGNIGATNVARVIGWKWGSVVLILDAIKGIVPTLIGQQVAYRHLPNSMWLGMTVSCGIAAIVGHMYPVYLRLRGGKGVATALGVVLVLAPKAVAAALVAFLLIAAATRIVALASIVAAVVFAVTELWLLGGEALQPAKLPLTVFSILIPLLIIWRHRSNIMRLIKGTEPAVTQSAAPDADGIESSETESGANPDKET